MWVRPVMGANDPASNRDGQTDQRPIADGGGRETDRGADRPRESGTREEQPPGSEAGEGRPPGSENGDGRPAGSGGGGEQSPADRGDGQADAEGTAGRAGGSQPADGRVDAGKGGSGGPPAGDDGQSAGRPPDGPDDRSASDGGLTDTLVRRRKLLIGGAVLAGIGFYGYTLFEEPEVTNPDVATERLERNGWDLMEDSSDTEVRASVGPIDVETARSTIQYRHAGLADEVKGQPVVISGGGETREEPVRNYVSGAFSSPLAVFSATRIDFGPDVDDLPAGLGLEEIMERVTDEAESTFQQELRDSGLASVRELDTRDIEVAAGETVSFQQYSAQYAFDGFTVEEGDTELGVPSDDIEIAGLVGTWKAGDNVLVAAGAYPNENFEATTAEESETGRTVELEVDLGLEPRTYRSQIDELVQSVE